MIGKYMHMSTEHLTPKTRQALATSKSWCPTVAYPHPRGGGWLVVVADGIDRLVDAGAHLGLYFTEDLLACMVKACRAGCDLILFDDYSVVYDDLPVYGAEDPTPMPTRPKTGGNYRLKKRPA
jgi:hypothetical protein